MKNVVSTGSLYSYNSDFNSGNGNNRRAMVPICELDFESRLCFNSRTLPKQKSVGDRSSDKNDFVVDYEQYKFMKRKKSQLKLAKSLKNCFDNDNEQNKEVFEKISLRSNYGSKLITSDISFHETPCSNRNVNELNTNHRNNSNYCSKTSLCPSIYSNRLTVNSNYNLPSSSDKQNTNNSFLINKQNELNDAKTNTFHSTYSLVSNTNNNKLCNLTTDYKINYNTNNSINNATNNTNNKNNTANLTNGNNKQSNKSNLLEKMNSLENTNKNLGKKNYLEV
jgi:hypothetical protein